MTINPLKMMLLLFALLSCKSDLKEGKVILSADLDTPMGHNKLNIYADMTFILEHRKLTKKTFYEGEVAIEGDTLRFQYTDQAPDFGDVAVIDGIFLTYTNGVYRELLEISVNEIAQ